MVLAVLLPGMAERERQLDREVADEELDLDDTEFDVDAVTELDDRSAVESAGLGSRVRSRLGSVLSPRAFGYSLLFALVGALALGAVLPLGIVGNLVGVFVAAFAYGTATTTRRYLELGLSGGILGGVLTLFGNLTLSLLGPGVPLVAVGFLAGAVAGGLGHYFGRDLRDGLTRDL
jgi:alkylation response protein AidB-like acyl-CoA dehydrogenase